MMPYPPLALSIARKLNVHPAAVMRFARDCIPIPWELAADDPDRADLATIFETALDRGRLTRAEKDFLLDGRGAWAWTEEMADGDAS